MGRQIGERVVLREFREEDISGMRSWMIDPESTRYLGGSTKVPPTYEMTEATLRRYLQGDAGGINWVIAEKESLRYLGQVSLIMVDNLNRRAELTVVMAPDQAGKGYGQEGVRLAVQFAFRSMNLHRVYLKVAADNVRAVHCYEKCGFQIEGRLKDDLFVDGQYVDVLCMALVNPAGPGATCCASCCPNQRP